MRIRIAATILALCGLAPIAITSLLGFEARAEQDWTTFTSKEGHFSIEYLQMKDMDVLDDVVRMRDAIAEHFEA